MASFLPQQWWRLALHAVALTCALLLAIDGAWAGAVGILVVVAVQVSEMPRRYRERDQL